MQVALISNSLQTLALKHKQEHMLSIMNRWLKSTTFHYGRTARGLNPRGGWRNAVEFQWCGAVGLNLTHCQLTRECCGRWCIQENATSPDGNAVGAGDAHGRSAWKKLRQGRTQWLYCPYKPSDRNLPLDLVLTATTDFLTIVLKCLSCSWSWSFSDPLLRD